MLISLYLLQYFEREKWSCPQIYLKLRPDLNHFNFYNLLLQVLVYFQAKIMVSIVSYLFSLTLHTPKGH